MLRKGLQANGARLMEGSRPQQVGGMHQMLVSAKKNLYFSYLGVFITFHSWSPENSPCQKRIGETYSHENPQIECVFQGETPRNYSTKRGVTSLESLKMDGWETILSFWEPAPFNRSYIC